MPALPLERGRPEKGRRPRQTDTEEVLADWTARALPMMGQRLASRLSFDMEPPQCEALGRLVVDRARRVAGDAFFKKGHMALDCRRTDSMESDDGDGVAGWRRVDGRVRFQQQELREGKKTTTTEKAGCGLLGSILDGFETTWSVGRVSALWAAVTAPTVHHQRRCRLPVIWALLLSHHRPILRQCICMSECDHRFPFHFYS